ncbi:DMT family transporter [Campylobacter curvus]|uniref:Guanidinium exporter n=1 Tax=Campylobacter curvus (strain 525.92) TaxID=360105 RepID=A7GWZ5_CAMC5|nr:SMR family transporter [Campylobacter curvus]EAU00921.1 multidrug efflux system protein, EmrE family [Campylobacter curvus 525.92]
MMHFLALLGASACEVLGVYVLSMIEKSSKFSHKATLMALDICVLVLSLVLLRYAMQSLPMSVAYAIWTGLGAIGAVVVGIVINGEKFSLKKGVCLFLIIFSVIMLKIV